MKTILHIVGTRPQIIKIASFLNSKNFVSTFKNIVFDTNQHYSEKMQLNLYKDFKINLNSINFLKNKKNTSNSIEVISNLITKEIEKIKPNIVIVYGDTNTTVAGIIAAKKSNIPSVHIEAGLRSFLKYQVEEKNRIFVDQNSDYLFCPTKNSIKNLKIENIKGEAFFNGDIMLDNFLKTKLKKPSLLNNQILSKKYYLATIHRHENIISKNKIEKIFKSFSFLDEIILLPLHHSLKIAINKFNILNIPKNLYLIEPLVYSEMLYLVKNSLGIVTDSGGLQKDAFWLEKPTITLRENTEWVETLKFNQNILINEFPSNLLEKISSIKIKNFDRYKDFGNGNAVELTIGKIKEILIK